MALVDADYRFCVIQVGDFGRTSDGGVFASSALGRGMEVKTMNVLSDTYLPGAEQLCKMPYVIVGDAAFPLKTYLMRPYPECSLPAYKRIFNYRLSRARRIVENAFGILAARRRIFHQNINMLSHKVDTVVEAACLLRNFLQKEDEMNHAWLDEAGQNSFGNLQSASHMDGNRASHEALCCA
ncbi:UNVERIFIED_CONTAM: hypothetical protein FKN15_068990 [Acipenser sinensis]